MLANALWTLCLVTGLVSIGFFYLGCRTTQLQQHGEHRVFSAVLMFAATVGSALVVVGVFPWGWLPVSTALLAGTVELATIAAAALILAKLFGSTVSKAALCSMFTVLLTGGIGFLLLIGCVAVFSEAFVIPTGSMAPAAYGAHAEVVCDNCQWRYDVSMSHRTQSYDWPTDDAESACPNCGHIRLIDPRADYRDGDRIFVENFTLPQRWEIACFEPPLGEGAMYIDRVAGLPGETVEIAAGDIFVDGVRAVKSPQQASEMWLPVHDTAFGPQTPVAGGPGWAAGESQEVWRRTENGGFRYPGGERGKLEFAPEVIDEFSYNVEWIGYRGGPSPPVVADVRTTIKLGEFECKTGGFLEWGREYGVWRVVARVDENTTTIEAEIKAIEPDGDEATTGVEPSITSVAADHFGGPLGPGDRFEFALRDGSAYVLRNGETMAMMSHALPQDVDEVKRLSGPLPASSRIWIAAENCSLAIERIRLDRDVYYSRIEELEGEHIGIVAPNPITLAADEYFMLGDNSRHSQDSRIFGPVSQEAIQGVLRLIYWPPRRMREFP